MTNATPSEDRRSSLSWREQAITALLAAATTDPALSRHARAAAAEALNEWGVGHRARFALFAGYADADARLAAIRAELLHRLARHAAPDAMPLPGLLAIGDATIPGWVAPLPPALRAATRPAPTRTGPWAGDAPALNEWSAIGRAIARDEHVTTEGLRRVDFLGSGVTVQLGMPAWSAVDGWGKAAGPQISVRRIVRGGVSKTQTWVLDVPTWRAHAALLAGLCTIDCMGLERHAAAPAKQCLQSAMGKLLGGAWTPQEAIEWCAVRLDALHAPEAAGEHGAHRRRPTSLEFAWPAAHAVVLGALDRFAATDAKPLTAPPSPGTWVHVWSQDGSEASGAGLVVAEPESHSVRRSVRRRRGVDEGADEPPTVWVAIADEVRPVPVALVQVARPAPLFD